MGLGWVWAGFRVGWRGGFRVGLGFGWVGIVWAVVV